MDLKLYRQPVFARQIELAQDRLRLRIDDRSEFERLIGEGLKFMHRKDIEQKLRLLKLDHFSLEMMEALICGGEHYHTVPIHYIWTKLKESDLVIQSFGYHPGGYLDHMLMVPALEMAIKSETLPNVFAAPAILLSRYAGAVVAIDVVTKEGDESRGTGFVVGGPEWHKFQIFTCKHNVDPADGITVKSITTQANASIDVGEWNFHPKEDIALAPIRGEISFAPAFWLRPDIEVFDEVYTLGFPKIPHSDAGIVGHRGEVNGFATPYQQGADLMLISNLVSPGNSGGPVIDRSGRCVGMSIRWLEGQWGQEKARFSAALPSQALIEMLR